MGGLRLLFVGCPWVPTPRRLCSLHAVGRKGWRHLHSSSRAGSREGMRWRPRQPRLVGPQPACVSAGLAVPALAFTGQLLPLHMGKTGVGGRLGLPIRSAPGVRGIIAQTPGRFRARGETALGNGADDGRRHVSDPGVPLQAQCLADCGQDGRRVGRRYSHHHGGRSPGHQRLASPIGAHRSTQGTVDTAVCRIIISTGAIIHPAPVVLTVPSRGAGASVNKVLASSWCLGGQKGAVIVPALCRA